MALVLDLEGETVKNTHYRIEVKTTKDMQLVLMSLEPGDDIERESHRGTQFIRVEEGSCDLVIRDKAGYKLVAGDAVMIPPRTVHYVKNTGRKELKLYTLYSPPQHPVGTVEG